QSRGLFCVESRTACRLDRYGGSDRRAGRAVRRGGGGSLAVAVQSSARGDGAVRRRGDRAGRGGLNGERGTGDGGIGNREQGTGNRESWSPSPVPCPPSPSWPQLF